MPRINFASHCWGPPDTLFQCPDIEKGIKKCQDNGKKVLMSIGGATADGVLVDEEKAKTLAQNLWNVFLGGESTQRPFGA